MDALPKRPVTMDEFQFITNSDRFEDARTGNWISKMVDDEVILTTQRVIFQVENKAVSASYFEECDEWLITQKWDMTKLEIEESLQEMTKFDILDNIITHLTAARMRCVYDWNQKGQPVANVDILEPEEYPMGE